MSNPPPVSSPGNTFQGWFRVACLASLGCAIGSLVFLVASVYANIWLFVSGCCALIANLGGFATLVAASCAWSRSRLPLYARWLRTAPIIFLAAIPSGYLGWIGCKLASLHDEAGWFAINGVFSTVGMVVAFLVIAWWRIP
jgi:hypothetical protein